jgi:hypothetical protein
MINTPVAVQPSPMHISEEPVWVFAIEHGEQLPGLGVLIMA